MEAAFASLGTQIAQKTKLYRGIIQCAKEGNWRCPSDHAGGDAEAEGDLEELDEGEKRADRAHQR